MRLIIVFLIAVACVFELAPARADFADDQRVCGDIHNKDYQARIAACTRQINSGRWQGHNLATSFVQRGMARQDDNDLDGAIADYGLAIHLDPGGTMPYMDRGTARRKKGDLEGAVADYNEAIRRDPNNGVAYFNRGTLRYENGDIDRAIPDFDQIIRLIPKFAVPYVFRGRARNAKGDADGAIADFNTAIQLAPTFASSFSGRCAAQISKGNLDAAIADCDEAIQLDNTNAEAYAFRGVAYERKNDTIRARADFNNAVALPENDSVSKLAHRTARSGLDSLPPSSVNTTVVGPAAPAVSYPVPGVRSGRRVALVIGNSAYVNVPRLANPANDARLMADTLSSLGFVLVGGGALLDLDEDKLRRAVRDFGSQLQGADVGLFYYAGHGVQVRGANYLVPVDANPTREADIDFQMVDGNLVLRQMEGAGAKLNIVILDACRNNPLAGRGLRATGGGLAQMEAPEGTLISFATQPGNVAQEGNGSHSPYTEALAQIMRKPGLDIWHTFNDVGLAVTSATAGEQRPWISSSPIKGDFYFAGAPAGATNP